MTLDASIPFSMKVSDYSRLEGLFHLADGQVRFEFYHRETIVNLFKSSLKDATVPIDRISRATHKKGWFGDRLLIQMKSMNDAEVIPGAKLGEVRMKIKKRDRDRAASIAIDLNYEISQQRLDELETRRH